MSADEYNVPPAPPKGGDPVNPAHYKSHPSGIECIVITREMNFNLGNATKYIWRFAFPGTSLRRKTDLEKAIWYLQNELKRLTDETF